MGWHQRELSLALLPPPQGSWLREHGHRTHGVSCNRRFHKLICDIGRLTSASPEQQRCVEVRPLPALWHHHQYSQELAAGMLQPTLSFQLQQFLYHYHSLFQSLYLVLCSLQSQV